MSVRARIVSVMRREISGQNQGNMNEEERGSIGEIGIEVRTYTYMLAELALPY